jgi:hypothetical protein
MGILSDAYWSFLMTPYPGDDAKRTGAEIMRDLLAQKARTGDKAAAAELQLWNRRFPVKG